VTDHLIPLFAVGAFLAFTLSQASMLVHWKRTGGKHARKSMFLNGLGAAATGTALAVILVSKFSAGAWVTVILVPAILLTMRAVRRHYDLADRETVLEDGPALDNLQPPLVVVPMDEWNKITHKALRFALSLSPDVIALHVQHSEENQDFREKWEAYMRPAAGSAPRLPELAIVRSPYRFVITPILEFVFELEKRHQDRQIAVVVPNLVERRWYQRFLHNQRGELLSGLLLLNGNHRTVIVNVPWYLRE
jgi:hypothetical protein